MSLVTAGGRRAWSRTKSDVSELVVHGMPPRIRARRLSRMGIDGFDTAGRGTSRRGMEIFGHSRHGGGLMRPAGRRDTW